MREDEIATLVNCIEEFVNAAISWRVHRVQEDAATLNRKRTLLEEYLKVLLGDESENKIDESANLDCPDCGGAMLPRTNRQNGQKFWGCKKYPQCKGTRDADGLSKSEREELRYKKESTHQESGFSFNRDKRSPSTEVSPPTSFNPFGRREE